MWLSEETGPRRSERGWAGISLQPAHAAASGEDVGTCAAVRKTDGGTLGCAGVATARGMRRHQQ